jgi:hypothetical protein
MILTLLKSITHEDMQVAASFIALGLLGFIIKLLWDIREAVAYQTMLIEEDCDDGDDDEPWKAFAE